MVPDILNLPGLIREVSRNENEILPPEEENLWSEVTIRGLEVRNILPEERNIPAEVTNILPEAGNIPAEVTNILPEERNIPAEATNIFPERAIRRLKV